MATSMNIQQDVYYEMLNYMRLVQEPVKFEDFWLADHWMPNTDNDIELCQFIHSLLFIFLKEHQNSQTSCCAMNEL
jgi:hypothetical protein